MFRPTTTTDIPLSLSFSLFWTLRDVTQFVGSFFRSVLVCAPQKTFFCLRWDDWISSLHFSCLLLSKLNFFGSLLACAKIVSSPYVIQYSMLIIWQMWNLSEWNSNFVLVKMKAIYKLHYLDEKWIDHYNNKTLNQKISKRFSVLEFGTDQPWNLMLRSKPQASKVDDQIFHVSCRDSSSSFCLHCHRLAYFESFVPFDRRYSEL